MEGTKRPRCAHSECKKVIREMKFPCRCEKVFCSLHRLPEEHACSFDYQKMGKEELKTSNQAVTSLKLVKI